MTFGAIAIGTTTTVAGLVISFFADVPSGSAIILLQAAVFLVATVVGRR